MKIERDKIYRTYLEDTAKLTKGEYTNIEQLLNEICPKTELENLDCFTHIVIKHLFTMNEFFRKVYYS